MGSQNLMKDKRGLTLKNLLFAVIAMSAVILATGEIMGEWGKAYESGITYDLESFEDLEGLSAEATIERDQLTVEDVQGVDVGFEGSIFRGGYGIFARIFTPLAPLFNMIDIAATRLGLPGYVTVIITTLITIAIVTMIISIIFRLPRSSA